MWSCSRPRRGKERGRKSSWNRGVARAPSPCPSWLAGSRSAFLPSSSLALPSSFFSSRQLAFSLCTRPCNTLYSHLVSFPLAISLSFPPSHSKRKAAAAGPPYDERYNTFLFAVFTLGHLSEKSYTLAPRFALSYFLFPSLRGGKGTSLSLHARSAPPFPPFLLSLTWHHAILLEVHPLRLHLTFCTLPRFP